MPRAKPPRAGTDAPGTELDVVRNTTCHEGDVRVIARHASAGQREEDGGCVATIIPSVAGLSGNPFGRPTQNWRLWRHDVAAALRGQYVGRLAPGTFLLG